MSEVTKPIALDESLHTTESTPRNLADVLAEGLSDLADSVKPSASDIPISPISGMSADDVQEGLSELKQSLDDKLEAITISDSYEAAVGWSKLEKAYTCPAGYTPVNAICSPNGGAAQVVVSVSYLTSSTIWVNWYNLRSSALTTDYKITVLLKKS